MAEQEKFNAVFPTRLRNLIKDRGTTITAVAKELGISRQAVSQYADGTGQPNVDKLTAIAAYFHVSADYLVGLSNYEQHETAAITAEDMGITDMAAKELARKKQVEGGLAGAFLSGLACSPQLYDLADYVGDYIAVTQWAEKYAHTPGSIRSSEKEIRIKKFLVSEKLFDLLDDVASIPNLRKRLEEFRIRSCIHKYKKQW